MDLTSPKNCLRQIWRYVVNSVATEEPPELDDEANYGQLPYRAASLNGYHPAVILGLQKRAEQFGRVFKTHHDLHNYVVPLVENMSEATYCEMRDANLVSPNNLPSPQ